MPAIAVIINEGAGSSKGVDVAELGERFRGGGLEPSVTLARSGSEVVEAARRAREGGTGIVVAGGGDGTINAVAGVLVGTDVALGVLPIGTLNHFAKTLHIPMKPDLAAETIIAGYRTRVDVGEVNGTIFLNNSSVGIYPEIVREREAEQRRFGRPKWVAFTWATLLALHRDPFVDVRLDVDGTQLRRQAPFVFIGNNEYAIDGFDVGERKSLDTGRLSLYVSRRIGRRSLFALALRALFGRLREGGEFDALLATEIVIESKRPRMEVATDGEVTMMTTPLRYRIQAGALNVIVPVPPAA